MQVRKKVFQLSNYKAQATDTFVGCYDRSTYFNSLHLQTYEVFENSSSLTDLPADVWHQLCTYIDGCLGSSPPPSSVSEETKNIQTHRAVFDRKSEVLTHMIRVWLNPEDVPSRNKFFALRSQDIAETICEGNDNIVALAGSKYCDYGVTDWRI
jgi:hypothetical protein